ncbi:hypothetical protein FQ087_20935 [Sporosarcina sp. ANT_H38]|nr:hypothetical protein FQ087_20935 [Sporosarcina sp. ANT_H38]
MGFFGKLITDGVMKGEANMLKVETSGSNMNTVVDTGTAFLKAREYENDSELSLTHEVEALGKSRIDRVVIRLMLNVDYREARAFVKKGVAGLAPVVPQLERTDDVYEISLAQVKVIGGQTYINVADVVDERGKEDVCPWAGSKILPNFDDVALAELVEKVNTGLVDATTIRKGIVKLNNTLTSTLTTEAATANTVKQVNDLKANKVQESPMIIPLVNGWTGTAKYYKDQFGVVHATGLIERTTSTTSIVAGNLPAGYRPVSTHWTHAIPISSPAPSVMTIGTDGRIDIPNGINGATTLVVNFSFRTN